MELAYNYLDSSEFGLLKPRNGLEELQATPLSCSVTTVVRKDSHENIGLGERGEPSVFPVQTSGKDVVKRNGLDELQVTPLSYSVTTEIRNYSTGNMGLEEKVSLATILVSSLYRHLEMMLSKELKLQE